MAERESLVLLGDNPELITPKGVMTIATHAAIFRWTLVMTSLRFELNKESA